MKEKYSYISIGISLFCVTFCIFAFTTGTFLSFFRLIMWMGIISAIVLAILSTQKGWSKSLAVTFSILLAIPMLLMEIVGFIWRNGGFGN